METPIPVFLVGSENWEASHVFNPNALIPFKTTKKNPLTVEQKAFNTMLSKLRVAIEHINRELKIFRICKGTYRGKGERGLLRVRLVASLYNHRVVF